MAPPPMSSDASELRYVVVVDMDNDTQLDIIVANYGTNNMGILFGYGNWAFLKQMMISTDSNSHPSCIAIGDFNDDTQLDIAVVNDGTTNTDIFLGFLDIISYPTGPAPFTVAVRDFNNDTQLDRAVVNGNDNDMSVLLGYGTFPLFLVVADFNNDNQLDIIVANRGSSNVSVLLGYGNGSFANQITYSTGSSPFSIAAGGFNNDNRLDVVVVNSYTNEVNILLATINTVLSINVAPWTQRIHDTLLRLDQKFRIVVLEKSAPLNETAHNQKEQGRDCKPDAAEPLYHQVIFASDRELFAQHSIELVQRSTLVTGDGLRPRSFVVGDFNSDSRMDIALANSGSQNIEIFLGYVAGDVNNDSRLNIVVANYGSESVNIIMGNTDGSFTNQITYSTGAGSFPSSVTAADLNNDNTVVIVVTNQGTGRLGAFLGFGHGTFSNIILFSMKHGSDPFCVITGDSNDGRTLDFAVANNGTDS
ncbi:unnamed protein product [Rotaria magnacalcarata]